MADRRALAAGTTVSGPHRSDLKLTFDGHEARGRASQGQIRLVVIAMKVALMQRITAQRDVVPVLLLDDVSSELDDTRSTHLSRYLYDAAGQVFATTTNAAAVGLDRADARFFAVDAGAVVRRERDVS